MREFKFRAWLFDFEDKTWKMAHHIYPSDIDGIPTALWGDAGFYLDGEEAGGIMQFTGLLDKNDLTEVYEGDIIDANGKVKGNIHESPQVYEEGVDICIEKMGTEAWRGSESIAMGRGCKYSQ